MWFLVDQMTEIVACEFFVAIADRPVPRWCSRARHRASVLARADKDFVTLHIFERNPELLATNEGDQR